MVGVVFVCGGSFLCFLGVCWGLTFFFWVLLGFLWFWGDSFAFGCLLGFSFVFWVFGAFLCFCGLAGLFICILSVYLGRFKLFLIKSSYLLKKKYF